METEQKSGGSCRGLQVRPSLPVGVLCVGPDGSLVRPLQEHFISLVVWAFSPKTLFDEEFEITEQLEGKSLVLQYRKKRGRNHNRKIGFSPWQSWVGQSRAPAAASVWREVQGLWAGRARQFRQALWLMGMGDNSL